MMENELSILLERFVSAMNKNPAMRKYLVSNVHI